MSGYPSRIDQRLAESRRQKQRRQRLALWSIALVLIGAHVVLYLYFPEITVWVRRVAAIDSAELAVE